MTERPPTVSEQLRADHYGITVADLRWCSEQGVDPAVLAAERRAALVTQPKKEAAVPQLTAEELAYCEQEGFDPQRFAALKAVPVRRGSRSVTEILAALRAPAEPDPNRKEAA